MALVTVKCPSCNNNVELEDSREFGFCIFCGTKIMVGGRAEGATTTASNKDLERWLSSCKKAYDSQNFNECHYFAKMVTDADGTNADAWFYRSVSAPDLAEAGFGRNQFARYAGSDDRRLQLCDERIESLKHGARGMSTRIDLVMPSRPADVKGTFRYFSGKFDDFDIGLCKPGDVISINTFVGIHHLSFRQMNSSLFGSNVVRLEEEIEISEGARVVLYADGKSLMYNVEKRVFL